MFTNAYEIVRESTYFLLGRSAGHTVSCGTAFMFAPGVLAAAAHALYKEPGDSSTFQNRIQVIRDPYVSVGHTMEVATVLAVDAECDIGLLRVDNPRTDSSVVFATDTPSPGTAVGAVGYPLMDPSEILARRAIPLLRFQGGYISATYARVTRDRRFIYYETDVPLYKGSSGCPGFLADGKVFGMHTHEWHDGGTEESPGQRAFSLWVPASAIMSFAQEHRIEIPTP